MLDENLPVFFLKPSGNGIKHHRDLYLSFQGSEPEPCYSLQNTDPESASPAHKNCYAAAVFDSYNTDVLYGEVLARPGWTQPVVSAEEKRIGEAVTQGPQPILPSEYVVQLYNPDQQVRVSLCPGKWGGSDSYEFSMPQCTFRTPSASNLDRGQSDPASLAITPKLNFVWRKESKLSKDMTCYMTGRSTDAQEKRRSRKDPDIAIALWRSLRELTLYEPNIHRLQLEDPKGLEVVLLLSAIVIKDIYFNSKEHMRTLFNMSSLPSEQKLSGGGRKLSNPPPAHVAERLSLPPSTSDTRRHSLPRLQTGQAPITDPRTQWELDTETARLRAQAEAEARRVRRQQEEKGRAEEAERRRLQRMVEEEEREARRKQAEVDKETERLRRKYGNQQPPNLPPRHMPNYMGASTYQQPQPGLLAPGSTGHSNGMYAQPSVSSPSLMMSGANPGANPGANTGASNLSASRPGKKKSFFRLRSGSND